MAAARSASASKLHASLHSLGSGLAGGGGIGKVRCTAGGTASGLDRRGFAEALVRCAELLAKDLPVPFDLDHYQVERAITLGSLRIWNLHVVVGLRSRRLARVPLLISL